MSRESSMEVNQPINDNIQKDNEQMVVENKQELRKRRRKRVDQDGRDFTCLCGKSYLSYPALYTHVKTKHNGELPSLVPQTKVATVYLTNNTSCLISQNESSAPQLSTIKPANSCNQNYVSSKPSSEQSSNQYIQKMRQFIFRQFLKQKQKQSLIEMKSTLKLKQQQINYINTIMKQTAQGPRQVHQNQNNSLNSQDEQHKWQDQSKMKGSLYEPSQQTGNLLKVGTNFRGQILLKQKQNRFSNSNKSEKKGFAAYLNIANEMQLSIKKRSKPQSFVINQIFGRFLSELFHTPFSQNHQLINLFLTFFICKLRQYFIKKYSEKFTNQHTADNLIAQASQIVHYFIEIQNSYLRQPIIVCKLLFYFYRWMWLSKFTCKWIKWNEAITNNNSSNINKSISELPQNNSDNS